MHQLSRMSLLVPVLTALQKFVPSSLRKPNVMLRAARSARISPTMKAAPGSITRRRSLPACPGCRLAVLYKPPLASAR
ncbi:hypothetical protein FQZ97_1045110 [compost metagenome]